MAGRCERGFETGSWGFKGHDPTGPLQRVLAVVFVLLGRFWCPLLRGSPGQQLCQPWRPLQAGTPQHRAPRWAQREPEQLLGKGQLFSGAAELWTPSRAVCLLSTHSWNQGSLRGGELQP